MRKDRWIVYNDQMNKVWKEYDHQTSLIGKSILIQSKKFFGLKKINIEKILSDSWIECTFDVINKDNVISKFNYPRVREFSDYSEILDKIRISLDEPGNIIKNFSINCKNSYIDTK